MNTKFRWEKVERLYGFEHDGAKYVTNGIAIACLQYCNPATEAIALRGFAKHKTWKRIDPLYRKEEFNEQPDFAEKIIQYLGLPETVQGEFLATACDTMQPDKFSPVHLFSGGKPPNVVRFGYADRYMAPFLWGLYRRELTIHLPPDLKRPAVIVQTMSKVPGSAPFIAGTVMPLRVEWESFAPMAKAILDEVERAKESEAKVETARLATLTQANTEVDRLAAINREVTA